VVHIPAELIEQVERGNVLLFVGERLSRDPSGAATFARLSLPSARASPTLPA
jgi:hypothetical protein